MIPGLSGLRYYDAANVSRRVLDRVSDVSTPPEDASSSATHAAAGFSPLEIAAQAAHDELVTSLAEVETADALHAQVVAAARAQEDDLDSDCAVMRDQLAAAAKGKRDGAATLLAQLFPLGSLPMTSLRGGPQLAEYEVWVPRANDPSAKANPAYSLVADDIQAFAAGVTSFAETMREKDRRAAALTAARAKRDAAQDNWTARFRELIAAGARIQGEDSETFRSWVQPILDWKAAQKAASTRRANAAEPEPDGSG